MHYGLKITFSNLHGSSRNFFVVRIYIYIYISVIYINVETGWILWACESGKYNFVYTPPVAHPFYLLRCNIIINKYY